MKKLFLALALLASMTGTAFAQSAPQVRPWSVFTTGSIDSAGDDVVEIIDAGGMGTLGITVTGTFTGTLEAQCAQNRSVLYQALQIKPTNSGTLATSISGTGMWTAAIAGCRSVRITAPSDFTSGTADIIIVAAAVGGGASSGGGGVGGGGTEFAEDSVAASGDAGTLNLAVRNDAGTSLCNATGDYCPLSLDATGAVRVTGGAGGTASNFAAAFPTAGTAAGFTDGTNMVAGRAVDADTGAGTFNVQVANNVFRTNGTPVEAGTSANPWNVVFPSAQAVTQSGAWSISFTAPQAVTQSGTWNINNVSGTVSLPTGASTLAEQQTQTTALQLIDNAVSGSGFNISQINGVTPLMGNGASGTGALRVSVASDSTGTLAVTQATAANLNAQVVGVAAEDAPLSGNPVRTGWRASSAVPTAMSANGDVVTPWASLFGAPNVIVRDSTGDSAMDDTNNALRVNVVTGAGGGASIADDAAFTVASTSLTPVGGTYRSTLDAVDDGDAGAFAMTQRRALHMSLRRESDGAEWGVAATAPIAVRFSDGSAFLNLASDSTHDSAVSTTGPLQLLEAASDLSANTAVADGDAVRAVGDLNGRAIEIIGCDRAARLKSVTTVTDGSSTSAIAAQGASIFIEVYDVVIANTSATAVTVDLRDGTAGSVMATLPVPANTAGVAYSFRVPITGTANTAVAVDPSAAASSIITTLSGCKAK